MDIWSRTDISWDEKQKLHLEQLEKEKREMDEIVAKQQSYSTPINNGTQKEQY